MRYRPALLPEYNMCRSTLNSFTSDPPDLNRDALPACATSEYNMCRSTLNSFTSDPPDLNRDALPACATSRFPFPKGWQK